MALSFEESKKLLSQKIAKPMMMAATPASMSVNDNSIMTLAAEDDMELIPAYSEWTKSNKYVWSDQYTDSKASYVDENKNITVDNSQINLTQEENSQFIPFEMPRYYDGFDLMETELSIHYLTSDGYHGESAPINVSYDTATIKFGWLVDGYATHVAGNVKFEIRAIGVNSNGDPYVWKSKTFDKMNVIQSLIDDRVIELDDSWVQELVTRVAENVAEQIAGVQVADQVEAAENAALRAETAATNVQTSLGNYYTKSEVDEAVANVEVDLSGYALKTDIPTLEGFATEDYVKEAVAGVDVTEQLVNYALKSEIPTIPTNVSAFDNDAGYLTEHQSLEAYALKNEIPSLEGLATEDYVNNAVAAVDVSEQLKDYAKSSDVYTKEEVDEVVSNVQVDLSGYYTKTEVDTKNSALSSSIDANTTSISSLNKTVEDINQSLADVDKSPRVTYDATYGNVELDDGTTAEYMFTLWKTEGGVREVQDRFQIMGGGGNTSSVVLSIAYMEGYTTPIVSTVNDSVIVKYKFAGEDSAGDTNLDGIASWKVGNRIVATQDVSTGECEFDLTDYVSIGDNKVVLTITHATGAVATKAWTIKVVDVRLESNFDDTRAYEANSSVNFTFTPYGGVDKTVHFLLDGKEIATKTSSAAAAGLSDSYAIPAQGHGVHLFEIYMTAVINGKTIPSNHIVKDIIWYDASSDSPVIGCVQQEFTARQYEATNIKYTVYDPSTENPKVTLRATYVNSDGEIVEEFKSELVLNSNTPDPWQYKTDVIGTHTLTITCGDTVKTLVATIVEIGINVSPITAGLVFDFNPVGRSNNDENKLWSYGNSCIAMSVSKNFDWVNGGYQIDENGDQCFCIKAGTSAEINYELFGDDAKVNGKQFKLIFKTENVANADTTFLSCVSDTTGNDKVGLEMKAHEATIYAKTGSLPLPYAEDEIIEFEFNITSDSENPSMIMGYEDGVSTRPLVYDATHDLQQHKDHRKTISLGSADCDLYIYRFKVYNTSLSDRDILNNFIADARSAEEMINRYNRNQIYKEGILDPDYLAEVCPQLRIIKIETPYFTSDKDEKIGRVTVENTNEVLTTNVECIYKGGDPVFDNWVATDVVHSGQGTSSNNYGPAGRNLDIIIKRYQDKKTKQYLNENPIITLSDNTQVRKVALTRNSVDVNYFNIKVNIASSENANNALLAKRYNDYNPYIRPIQRSSEEEAAKVKDTMEFQNCVIFVKETHPDVTKHREFNDNNWHKIA